MDVVPLLCLLLQAGVEVEHIAASPATVFAGQEVEVWPRIVWSPRWALTFADVKKKVQTTASSGTGTGAGSRISTQSTLVLEKPDVRVEGLLLDGALVVDGSAKPEVVSVDTCLCVPCAHERWSRSRVRCWRANIRMGH